MIHLVVTQSGAWAAGIGRVAGQRCLDAEADGDELHPWRREKVGEGCGWGEESGGYQEMDRWNDGRMVGWKVSCIVINGKY